MTEVSCNKPTLVDMHKISSTDQMGEEQNNSSPVLSSGSCPICYVATHTGAVSLPGGHRLILTYQGEPKILTCNF